MLGRIKWHLLRRWQLKKKGILVHRGGYVCPNSIVRYPSRFGKGVEIYNSDIGAHTYVVSGRIASSTIGRYCSIGPGVSIGGLGIHPTNFLSTAPAFYSNISQTGFSYSKEKGNFKENSDVTIGNDVWIGANAVVLDGVNIGDGAVIAAGAVVVKNVEPYAIVGGVPARLLRYRFSPDICSRLIAIAWWNLPEVVLREALPCFICEVNVDILNELEKKLVKKC